MRRRGDPTLETRWREEFPYHWDADAMVNRREFVRFAVLTSGALFAGTVVLSILGKVRSRKTGSRTEIARASEVPAGSAFYFKYPTSGDQAVLLHLENGQFVAYSQKCTHLSCAVYFQSDQRRLYCPCHDGVFDPATGEPTSGPPQRRLPRIAIEQDGDAIYAREQAP